MTNIAMRKTSTPSSNRLAAGTCKLDFDPNLRVFTLAKPYGRPHDWGFIPID